MSGTVIVNFSHPNPAFYLDGAPMTIDHVRIESRVDGAQSWTEVAQVPPTENQISFPDTPGGRWHFRGIVVPTDGDPSAPLVGEPVDVPFGQASPLESFEVSIG